jgi:putative PIN family toxin of toxin-antitoxin system
MIWVSFCTLADGYRHRLLERAHRQGVRLFVSEYILNELTETLVQNLGRTRRFASLARRAVLRIATCVDLPPVSGSYVPGDPKDDPIVQTALSAKTDYLVTADSEILELGQIQDVRIITAAAFELLLPPEE